MRWFGRAESASLAGHPSRPGIIHTGRILLLLFLAAFCSFAEPAKRKVVVGINRDFPPYEYLDANGKPAGYDVDLLRAVAEVESLDLEFRADTWDNTLNALRESRLDLLPGLLYSKERQAFTDFSTPHLVVHYAIFVRRGDARIQDETGLKGRRILVERQSQMHDHLRSAGFEADLIPVDSEPEALRRLAAGDGDAAAAPQLEGMVLAKEKRLAIHTVGGPIFTRQLCFATRKGEAELLSRLNTGLAILNQTGRYAEIYQASFGGLLPNPQENAALIRRILFTLAFVAAALLLTVSWNWFLRRRVARATLQIRHANREIRAREAYLHTVIESLPVAIFGKDPRHGYVFTLWNARSEEIFGLRKEEVLGRSDYDLFPKDQSDFFRAKDEEVIRNRQSVEIPEEQVLTKALGEITLQTREVPLFDEKGEPFLLLGISENITERRAMEAAVRQTQKLESLGVLAGGIAHDFNNLLTAILGNLGLASLQVSEDHPIQRFLDKAKTTSLRAAELTRQMLAYAGKGVFTVKPLDLSQVAEEITNLLEVSISKRVRLQFGFSRGLPCINADPAQIQQVVMNLVTNASEAIGEAEGDILLATGLTELTATRAATLHPGSPIPPGRYVTLCVKDTGVGMSAEVLSQIFDPFFTTKFSGRGLGLSTMLGILRAHHAGIGITSEPGRGTEFHLYFPEYGLGPTEDKTPSDPAVATPLPGVVLLVEDEPEIRKATGAMLHQAGFEVLEAVDGAEACEVFRQAHPRIQVILMDLNMPQMDGRSAAREILAIDPKARILLTSGFPMDMSAQGIGQETLRGFIQKPYQLPDLLAALQRVMVTS
jgi:PAS domain S-box-containing protein